MGSLIRAASLMGFKELVQELGGDPHELMGRWNLPVDIARRPDTFYQYQSFAQVLETTAGELDCPDFGMQLGSRQSLGILGPIAVIARNAENVVGAFEAIGRFLYVHSPALKVALDQPPGCRYLRLTYGIVERGLPQRQVMELSMAVGMQILGLLAGPKARPQAMFFPHAQMAPAESYKKIFRCRVHFEQTWCGFHISEAVATQRIDSADPQTRQLATAYLESHYSTANQSFASQVQELIRRLLPTGQCTIQMIAEQLALHHRTLQRRLAQEGVGYEELVDGVRQEMASHYLSESGLYLSQITGLLGYAEQSTFNRACRRWFGTTPRKFRLEQQAEMH